MSVIDDDLPCGDCGARMILRDSKFGKFYGCSQYPSCKGTHGAHPDGTPLGIPADAATRKSRMSAHAALEDIKSAYGWTTNDTYRWLSKNMGMPRDDVHIGVFTKDECDYVVSICQEALL